MAGTIYRLLALAAAFAVLVVPNSFAEGEVGVSHEDVTCDLNNTQAKQCEGTLGLEKTLTLNCASGATHKPTNLFASGQQAVCYGTKKGKTGVDTNECNTDTAVTLVSNIAGLSVDSTSTDTSLKIKNSGPTATANMYVSGSCEQATGNSYFFNVLINSTSSTKDPNSGKSTTVGLVGATLVALLGLAAF